MRPTGQFVFSDRDVMGQRLAKAPPPPAADTIRRMFDVAEGALRGAERFVSSVVEIDPRLAAALEQEVLLVTGRKAVIQPKILTPSSMFLDGSAGDERIPASARQREREREKLFPQIPASRLALDWCGVQYNALLVQQRADALRHETSKNKSNALYLADIRVLLADLTRLMRQRDGLDHVMFQAMQQIHLLGVPARVLAEQLTLLDCANFAQLRVEKELEFSGWLGQERRLRAPHLTAQREFAGFVSHWVAWEVLRPEQSPQQRAECVIHLVAVGKVLADLASYHMLLAVIRGLSCPAILRLRSLATLLPKRTVIEWDRLQLLVLDGTRHRALVSKAPATCIPALDTAYLSELLYFEPQLLTATRPADPSTARHKFVKYCAALERLRFQAAQTVPAQLSLHPAIQHFILTRPFWSDGELMAASKEIEATGATPADYPVRLLHRRYLDDPDRLFFPLVYSARQEDSLPVAASPVAQGSELELGEQPDNALTLAPVNDVEERVARRLAISNLARPSLDAFQLPIETV